MKKILDTIDGYKTYIVVVVAIIYSIVLAWVGQITWIQAGDQIIAALGLGGIRSALSK